MTSFISCDIAIWGKNYHRCIQVYKSARYILWGKLSNKVKKKRKKIDKNLKNIFFQIFNIRLEAFFKMTTDFSVIEC